jgi:TorA maturation chaperone TorD
MDVDFGKGFLSKPENVVCEELAVEYARLFVGPGSHIAPYESVHSEGNGGGMLCGNQTVTVKRVMEAAGLELGAEYHDLPDHVSIELEYMFELTSWEADAWAKSDECAAQRIVLLEKEFLHDHILKWIPSFCEQVTERASHSFYHEMAALTSRFLELEVEHISSSLESRQANLVR